MAVDHLHCHGIAHLNISLENILITKQLGLSLIGLDLCRRMPRNLANSKRKKFLAGSITPTNQLIFTDPQIFNRRDFDGASADLYSCGVCLFMLLSKAKP